MSYETFKRKLSALGVIFLTVFLTSGVVWINHRSALERMVDERFLELNNTLIRELQKPRPDRWSVEMEAEAWRQHSSGAVPDAGKIQLENYRGVDGALPQGFDPSGDGAEANP